MIHKSIEDKRSGKVVFVSHCYLNQNAKVRGIATFPGVHKGLIDIIVESDAGIIQMPCPEMGYMGAMRWGQVKDQYDSPMFRRHCRKLADMVLDQAEEYLRSGYQVLAFIMADGSPACGLEKIPQPEPDAEVWGGMVWYIPQQQFVQGSGVFCEVLQEEVRARNLSDIPFTSIPEVEEVGSLDEALNRIRNLLL